MLTTIAVQVHHMDNMVAFYRQAFGFTFQAVDTFGLASQFGTRDGLTLKFVPLRYERHAWRSARPRRQHHRTIRLARYRVG